MSCSSRDEGQTLWKVRRYFREDNIPTILCYGSSHLTNLKKWLRLYDPRFSPRFLDRKISRNTHFCAVGGASFANVHDRVRGLKVPLSQPFRGNIWRFTTHVKEVIPDFIFLVLGSNDCDLYDRKLKQALWEHEMEMPPPGRPKQPFDMAKFNEEHQKIFENIDTVIGRLRHTFPGAQLIFFGVLKRARWCLESRQLSMDINWWIKQKHGAKVVQIGGFIHQYWHLRDDGVHLTSLGNRVLMDKVFSRIVQVWMSSYMHDL